MNQLMIYDTKTQQKKPFVPLDPNKIGIYVCGITVYDDCHIGHARTFVAFDIIVRYLKHKYGADKVRFVRNITDIDDKIIKRAQERGITTEELTTQYINSMYADMAALNVQRADAEPRATEYIAQMCNLVQKLIDKGFAYQASNGDVYYKVRAFKPYGCLAKRNLDDLAVGQRVEVNEAKNDPLDFVLWKAAKPGEPQWDSPWGPGRPGWHLECSAMSMDLLGETFDLHGGGFDLIFPHHENECAQSEAATGQEFVKTWLHTGFLQINKDKMSKSLHNFVTIKEALQFAEPEQLRYFMLAGHYRSALDYDPELVKQTAAPLERLYRALLGTPKDVDISDEFKLSSTYEVKFMQALDDDFNTPQALAALFDLAGEINRLKDDDRAIVHKLLLRRLGGILGILQRDPAGVLGSGNLEFSAVESEILAKLDKVAAIRERGRTAKKWAVADQARDLLLKFGVKYQDKATNEQGASNQRFINKEFFANAIKERSIVTELENFISEQNSEK